MTEFEKDVFLSPEITNIIADIRNSNKDVFELFNKLNRLSHEILFDIKVDINNEQHLIIACLFNRSLSTYQGVAVLAERGMPSEATVVLRTLLEIMFRICAISKDKAIALVYIGQDELYRKNGLNKIKELSQETLDTLGNPKLDDKIREITENIKRYKIKKTTTKWYAEKADLLNFYNSAYTIFSQSVHVSVRNLEKILILKDDNIIGFNYGPEAKDIVIILMTAIESMIFVLNAVVNIFSTTYSDKIKDIHEVFRKKYGNLTSG